jgi:nicotinate dehydrogenase subunit B
VAPVAAAAPDPKFLNSWIAVNADNTATAFMGKVELGQGTTTGMMQIAAEELDLAMSQVSVGERSPSVALTSAAA